MLRIAVVDDEPTAASYISEQTKMYAAVLQIPVTVSIFHSGRKFWESYQPDSFDVAFLDIEMPEMNGDELSAKLVETDPSLLLVYVTNLCGDEVYTMLKYMPIGFLRKPYFEAEIDNMLRILQKKVMSIQKIYTVQSGKSQFQISLRDIVYAESERNYIWLRLRNKESIKIRKKLDDLETEIETYGFIRIHIGYLVNFRDIYSIEKKQLALDDGTVLPISRNYEAKVQQKFLYFSRRTRV